MRGHLGHTAKFACRQVASFRTSAFRGRGQPTRADRDLPLLARSRRIDSQAGHAGDTRTAHVVTVGLVPVEQLTLVPQREQASVTRPPGQPPASDARRLNGADVVAGADGGGAGVMAESV